MPTATSAKTKTQSTKTQNAKAASSAKPRSARTRSDREAIDRTAETADQVLEQLKSGGQSVVGAVRRFVGSVDEALPGGEDGPSRGHDIVDSALDMTDRIIESGSEAIRGIVRTFGGRSNDARRGAAE